MASPAFRINGGAVGAKASIAASTSFSATLDSTDGVRSCTWAVIGTDETTTAASFALAQSGSVGQTVTLTSAGVGTAGILRCEINGGQDLQTEQASATTRATGKWYVSPEVGCVNEQMESDSSFGWTGIVNAGVRAVYGGGSLTDVTGTAPVVITTPSAGVRNVAVPVASHTAAGLLSDVFWDLLNGATSALTALTLAMRNADGGLFLSYLGLGGGPATAGDLRLSEDGTIVGVNTSGANAPIVTLAESNRLIFGGHQTATEVCTAAAVQFKYGSSDTAFMRLCSGTPTAFGDLQVNGDLHVPMVWGGSSGAESLVRRIDAAYTFMWSKLSADSAGNTATAAVYIGAAARDLRLEFIEYMPQGSLTADDTHYATFVVEVNDGAGSFTTILSRTTQFTAPGTGSWVADNVVDFSADTSTIITAGSWFRISITKSDSTGVVVPAGVLVIGCNLAKLVP